MSLSVPATRAVNLIWKQTVGDVLRRRAELGDGPVGGVAFGDVVRAGVVDEAFREGGGQHQLALGDGDEAVSQPVKPELGAAGLADAAVWHCHVNAVASARPVL